MHRLGTDSAQTGPQRARAEQAGRAGRPQPLRAGLLALGFAGVLAGCAGEHATQPVAVSGKPDGIYQASGNEPSWNMTLAQKMLTLETPDGPRTAAPVLHAHAEGQDRIYETKSARVEITSKACSDSMSGQNYADTVQIVTQNRTLTGCGGAALAPNSLNGTRWVVTALDGQRLVDGSKAPSDTDRTTDQPGLKAGAPDMAPTLDINDSGKVSGSDGCNRYVGGLEFGKDGRVKAAPQGGVSTLMACPGRRDTLARQFSTLTRAATHWRMEGTTLVLETADKKTVRLRQVF
ncbi:META domain-containing protein [Acetobacter persici]|uniref:META domain-containing protein n=1 Tax=Acetobacter persici TaxID=1076596 RepID=UPI00098D1578|nr:META domain-containing protein [Acetobacter persici]